MMSSCPGILFTNNSFESVKDKLPTDYKTFSYENYINEAKSIEAIVTTPAGKVDEKLINSLPCLKIIACFGTGVDNVDLKSAAQRNIVVTNTPDVVTEDTADLAMALILSLARNIVINDKFVRKGQWKNTPSMLGTSLSGKTIGIVGLGRIGKSIATRAKTFGLKISYHGRTNQSVPYTYYADLTEMAKASDFLIVSCTGGESTKNIINSEILKSLGKKGFLINVSRGSTVNEADLLDALENKIIKGAGLDVYQNEPDISERFFALENAVLLPHVGTATQETRLVMLNLVVDNIISFFQTGQALTPVDLSTPSLTESSSNAKSNSLKK